MVYVTHNRDDRCSRLQIFFFILEKFQSFFLFLFLYFGNDYTDAQLVSKNENGILINILVNICHNPHLHQCHDNLRSGYTNLFTETCYRDRSCDRNRSCWKSFQNILFFLHNLRFRFVMLLWLRLFFKRTLLHSVFVFLTLTAFIQFREFVSFLIVMIAFFGIFLVRFCLHLG